MQIKSNSIERRIPPLLPVHNPIPPILYPIRLFSASSKKKKKEDRTTKAGTSYPIDNIKMINIGYTPLILLPNHALDTNQPIILLLLPLNNMMTTSEHTPPCRPKPCTEGEVADIRTVRT